uniref:DDB1- and CUL4-associated factor 5-like n=1 Tax=Phallusia mammillata TaxID=59560 RepID=A0A6F9DB44_9ASCI|nr:DDB1- and CUL4-associated factor 5-like [Phallusia mammillata]
MEPISATNDSRAVSASKKKTCNHSLITNVPQYNRLQQSFVRSSFTAAFRVGSFTSSKHLYSRNLVAHYGCVNALEFSHKSGELLATAGDDKRVLLWKVGEMLLNTSYKPTCMKGTHVSNIFCLGFDNQNKMLMSSGNDEQVIIHDVATGQLVNMMLRDDAVYAISNHPTDVNVFATASEDGKVHIMDNRRSNNGSAICLCNYIPAFHGVAFNTYAPLFVAASHSKEGVGLWDIRKPKSILLKYSPHQQDSTMSVQFNEDGTQLFVLRRRAGPVLYNVHDPEHIACFEETGYFNSCTMKSGCFAGENDEYVVSGSDDFNVYVWNTPEKGNVAHHQIIKPSKFKLCGHKSIVNQVRYNKQSQVIVSSGVEKAVKLWSPLHYPGCTDLGHTLGSSSRPLYTRNEYINLVLHSGTSLTHNYENESTAEDPRMIAFFDSLIQHDVIHSSDDDDADDDLLGLRLLRNSASQSSLDNLVQEIYSSSSSSDEDNAVEDSVASYYWRRVAQSSHQPTEDSVNYARLRALRATLALEEDNQQPNQNVEENNNDVVDEDHPLQQSDSALNLSEENVSLLPGSSAPSYVQTLNANSEDSGCESEAMTSRTRQKNANRKRKGQRWVINEGKPKLDQSPQPETPPAKAHCSNIGEPDMECSATSAYNRSIEKLNCSVVKTDIRLAKVADSLAKALNTSDDDTDDEGPIG